MSTHGSMPKQGLADILAAFPSSSLGSLDRVALMNRVDTKFAFATAEVPGLLQRLVPHYSVLTIDHVRAQRYETVYFDTASLALYLKHHNGVYPRHKVRSRRYVDSGACFLEIKTKKNTGRTIKQRIPSPCVLTEMQGPAQEFLRAAAPGLPTALQPMLWVGFTRVTFVNDNSAERLTLDLDLTYRQAEWSWAFPNLAIAELKRVRSTAFSPFLQAMRERRLLEGGTSKYCLGIMALYPEAKRNRFKERWRQIAALAA